MKKNLLIICVQLISLVSYAAEPLDVFEYASNQLSAKKETGRAMFIFEQLLNPNNKERIAQSEYMNVFFEKNIPFIFLGFFSDNLSYQRGRIVTDFDVSRMKSGAKELEVSQVKDYEMNQLKRLAGNIVAPMDYIDLAKSFKRPRQFPQMFMLFIFYDGKETSFVFVENPDVLTHDNILLSVSNRYSENYNLLYNLMSMIAYSKLISLSNIWASIGSMFSEEMTIKYLD